MLNLDHPLCVRARKIDWIRFEVAFAECYPEEDGAPGKDIRLLVGLHYLKHTFNVSDESLLEPWIENPYWKYFCGFSKMEHTVPLHSTCLAKWRQRVGVDRLIVLLNETVAVGGQDRLVMKKELARVNVDKRFRKRTAHTRRIQSFTCRQSTSWPMQPWIVA